MSPFGSDGQLRVVLQVRSKSSQVRASENSRMCTKHPLAIERLAPKENRFLGSTKLFSSLRKHGQGGGKSTKGTTVTGLGWPSSDKQ